MKKLYSLLLQTACILLLTSCNPQSDCLQGKGQVETRMLDIDPFSEISVNGSMHVFVAEGSPQRVEVKGEPNILDVLEKQVKGDIWEIGFNQCVGDHETVEVYLTVPALEAAGVDGSGHVGLQNVFNPASFKASVSGSGSMKLKLDTEQLTSRISGSGSITAEGVADQHEIYISGSGNNNSAGLRNRQTDVTISGSGKAEVNARHLVDAHISGSGRVFYKGSPKVNADVSGSGKVINR
ncbi:head GIN domain-containing protein [Pontibacter sp. CAU 1760]